MRGLTRRWKLRPGAAEQPAPVSPTLDPLVQRILLARGFREADAMQRFCDPRLLDMHDPGLLPNIDEAVSRLIHAVRQHERIVIYSDYDVDGITAAAILYHIIRTADPDAHLDTYVPHRLEEGYGINSDALRQIKAQGADLVISVDCGITAHEPAQVAREIELDLIITDHHHVPPEIKGLPDAIIVHPHLPGREYPFAELCGAGVAFKIAWRFATQWCGSERVSEIFQQMLLNLLPLAALGTIADVVPLVGENRVIARHGLHLIKITPLVGLHALIEASNLLEEKIDSEKVGFILAPRLNACGRMGHAAEAQRLLTTAGEQEAKDIARRLTQLNRQRQKIEREIHQQAAQMAEDAGMTRDDCRIIILAHESWHPGVVGIVCSRLVDQFSRPTILMQKQDDLCKGSARSIEGYSIHQALQSVDQYLTTYGGHDMAAGLSLTMSQLDHFTTALTEHAGEHIQSQDLLPSISIDCDAQLEEFNVPAVQRINTLSPFGRDNPRPMIRIRNLTVAERPRQIGAHGKHLALRFRAASGSNPTSMRAVWWRAGHLAEELAPGMTLDAALHPKINEWNGRTTVEAELRDVRLCEA